MAPEPALRPERGETLVEILVAVVILGLTVTAILGLLGVDIAGSARHRSEAVALTMLTTGVEHVKLEASRKNVCADGIGSISFDEEPQRRYELRIDAPVALDGSACDAADRLFLVHLTVALGGADIESVDVVVRSPA